MQWLLKVLSWELRCKIVNQCSASLFCQAPWPRSPFRKTLFLTVWMWDPMNLSSKPQRIALWTFLGPGPTERMEWLQNQKPRKLNKGDFLTFSSEGCLRLLQPICAGEQFKRPAMLLNSLWKSEHCFFKSLVVILKILFQLSDTSVKFSRVHEDNFQSTIKEKNLASDNHCN